MRISHRQTATLVAALLLIVCRSYAAPASCTNSLAAYDGYTVLSVDVKNLIGVLSFWTSGFGTLKNQIQMQANAPFTLDKLNQDTSFITRTLQAGGFAGGQKLRVVATSPRLSGCDPDARTLHVEYIVFSNVLNPSFAPTIESEQSESERPATTGAARADEGGSSVTPLVGYNQTRGTFG